MSTINVLHLVVIRQRKRESEKEKFLSTSANIETKKISFAPLKLVNSNC